MKCRPNATISTFPSLMIASDRMRVSGAIATRWAKLKAPTRIGVNRFDTLISSLIFSGCPDELTRKRPDHSQLVSTATPSIGIDVSTLRTCTPVMPTCDRFHDVSDTLRNDQRHLAAKRESSRSSSRLIHPLTAYRVRYG